MYNGDDTFSEATVYIRYFKIKKDQVGYFHKNRRRHENTNNSLEHLGDYYLLVTHIKKCNSVSQKGVYFIKQLRQ